MKTRMRDTSLNAYNNAVFPTMSNNQKIVYEVIQRYRGCSDKEIATILDWEINKITGRRNELEAKGLIFDYGKKMDFESNTLVHTWSVEAQEHILVF